MKEATSWDKGLASTARREGTWRKTARTRGQTPLQRDSQRRTWLPKSEPWLRRRRMTLPTWWWMNRKKWVFKKEDQINIAPSFYLHFQCTSSRDWQSCNDYPHLLSQAKRTQKIKPSKPKPCLIPEQKENLLIRTIVNHLKLETWTLGHPLKVYNVDRTPNKQGTITKYVNVELMINGKPWRHNLFVTGLGKQKIILGFNPDIDWDKGTLTWRELKKDTQSNSKPIVEEEKDEEE